MLLSLLKPEVRIQYAKADEPFPIPEDHQRFVGASINLNHSSAVDFSNRRLSREDTEAELLFGDFVNYVLAIDLLKSCQQLGTNESAGKGVGIKWEDLRLKHFVEVLKADLTWNEYLAACDGVQSVMERMKARIQLYRRFLHFNDKMLSEELRNSKTAIGAPLTSLVIALRTSGVLAEDVNVFAQIDQYEELANLSTATDGIDYRAVINRALAKRDPNVSYKIGARGHAWRDHGILHGVEARLEEGRDFKFIRLEQILRRTENRKGWVFPSLAQDVFARRLRVASLAAKNRSGKALLDEAFDGGLKAEDKARKYAGSDPERCIRVEEDWSPEVKRTLLALAHDDPLSARLGESWVLQGKPFDPSGEGPLPWNEKKTAVQWWRKERIEISLMQIAGRRQQRPFWCGSDEILDLSGSNLLAFLTICQFIWDALIQMRRIRNEVVEKLEEVAPEIQAVGIFAASEHWFSKIGTETGDSAARARFIAFIGARFGRSLLQDRRLSYPGHNGFSIADDDLANYPEVRRLLEEMADFGKLERLPHTTNRKDRRGRHKWYLNPILCPRFKLPYQITKEPMYVKAEEVERWLIECGSLRSKQTLPPAATAEPVETLPLFSGNR